MRLKFIQQNKTVPESKNQKFREWWCKKFGHITTGPFYGMPQSHCRRCGKRNWCAMEDSPEYSEVWGPFFN